MGFRRQQLPHRARENMPLIKKKKKIILFSDNDPKVTLFPGNDPEPHVSAICWATMKEKHIAVMSDGSQRKDLWDNADAGKWALVVLQVMKSYL